MPSMTDALTAKLDELLSSHPVLRKQQISGYNVVQSASADRLPLILFPVCNSTLALLCAGQHP